MKPLPLILAGFFAPRIPASGDLGSECLVRITYRKRRDCLSQIDDGLSRLPENLYSGI